MVVELHASAPSVRVRDNGQVQCVRGHLVRPVPGSSVARPVRQNGTERQESSWVPHAGNPRTWSSARPWRCRRCGGGRSWLTGGHRAGVRAPAPPPRPPTVKEWSLWRTPLRHQCPLAAAARGGGDPDLGRIRSDRDLDRTRTLAAAGRRALVPASTSKILTAAAALADTGPTGPDQHAGGGRRPEPRDLSCWWARAIRRCRQRRPVRTPGITARLASGDSSGANSPQRCDAHRREWTLRRLAVDDGAGFGIRPISTGDIAPIEAAMIDARRIQPTTVR